MRSRALDEASENTHVGLHYAQGPVQTATCRRSFPSRSAESLGRSAAFADCPGAMLTAATSRFMSNPSDPSNILIASDFGIVGSSEDDMAKEREKVCKELESLIGMSEPKEYLKKLLSSN